jgi:hypothetical protein
VAADHVFVIVFEDMSVLPAATAGDYEGGQRRTGNAASLQKSSADHRESFHETWWDEWSENPLRRGRAC